MTPKAPLAALLSAVLSLSLPAPDASAGEAAASAQPESCRELSQKFPNDLPARLCAQMPLEDKISQMFMSYPPLDKTAAVTVGAVIMLGPTLKSASKLKSRVQDLQSRAKIPLLVAVDMEGGQLNRLQFVPALKDAPSGKKLGEMSAKEAEDWGTLLGREMKALGLNCNLGPVLDLASKGHMFDKERSMGSDPESVAESAKSYVRGMWKSGVVGFGKHFPGYGDTDLNSDHELVRSKRTKVEIERQKKPFTLLGRELGGVLLTNIAFENLGKKPAILSKEAVEMAHAAQPDWVTMTDDIAVKPLLEATGGDAAEVVRQAFLAGNDMILTTAPIDWEKALDLRGILRAEVDKAPELERRIDQSVLRILRLKERMGLLDGFKKAAKKKAGKKKANQAAPEPAPASKAKTPTK